MSFSLGDRVVVDQFKEGTMKYLGIIDGKEGIWAGIELDLPLGKNDGSVKGKRYFDCAPMKGLFIKPNKLKKSTSTVIKSNFSFDKSQSSLSKSSISSKYFQDNSVSNIPSPVGKTPSKLASMKSSVNKTFLKTPMVYSKVDAPLQSEQFNDETLMLSQELESKQKEIENLSQEKTVAYTKLEALEMHLTMMEQEHEQLKKELLGNSTMKDNSINQLQLSLEDTKKQLHESVLRVESLGSQAIEADILKKKLNDAETTIASLKQKDEQNVSLIEQQKAQVSELTQLKNEVETLKKERVGIEEEFQRFEATINSLTENKMKQELFIEELQSKLVQPEDDEEKRQLQIKVFELANDAENFEFQKAELSKKVTALQELADEKQIETEQLSIQIARLEKLVNDERIENSKLEKVKSELKYQLEDFEAIQAKLRKLENENEFLQSDREEYKNEVQLLKIELKEKNESNQTTILSLEREKQELIEQHREAAMEYETALEMKDETIRQLQNIKGEITDYELNALETEISKKENEMDNESFEANFLSQMGKQKTRLEKDLDDQLEDLAILEKENVGLKHIVNEQKLAAKAIHSVHTKYVAGEDKVYCGICDAYGSHETEKCNDIETF